MNFDQSQYSKFNESMEKIRQNRGASDLYTEWCNPRDLLQRSEEVMLSAVAEYEISSRVCTPFSLIF